ncbi:MAG: sulfite exporter TauE/SafE family protein [Actinomycetota bacterium]
MLLLGTIVGFFLGFFGGGGSILAVPALVWGMGMSPQVSVAVSLAVVGPAAALGAVSHARAGNVALRTAWLFGAPAIAASYLAGLLGRNIPDRPLLAGFGILALAAAIRMLTKPPQATVDEPPDTVKSLIAGAAVGSVTGLFGVGGGFIVVPALLLVLHLSMTKAVGTSLVVIAATASSALLARAGDLYLDLNLILFAGAALVAVLAGSAASRVTDPDRLRKAFAVVLILVALGTMAEAFDPEPATLTGEPLQL